jgi:hypothetical protein
MNMKTSLLVLLVVSAFSVARADSFTVVAASLSATTPAIKASSLEAMLLPYKEPADPKESGLIPFDPARPLRGALTPSQLAVTARTLSAHKLVMKDGIKSTISSAARLDISSTDGKQSRAISISATALPDNKVLVKIFGSDLSTSEETTVELGQTLLLSTPGKTESAVDVYFVTITKG